MKFKHVEDSYAHSSTWNPCLCSFMTLQFHILFGLCRTDLVLPVSIQRWVTQGSFFVPVPLTLLRFSTQFFRLPLCHAKYKLLVPTFKSLTTSPFACHLSLPYQEVNSMILASSSNKSHINFYHAIAYTLKVLLTVLSWATSVSFFKSLLKALLCWVPINQIMSRLTICWDCRDHSLVLLSLSIVSINSFILPYTFLKAKAIFLFCVVLDLRCGGWDKTFNTDFW